MSRIRRHLSYANVISTLCLFLLLGGGTAVALNGTNTVQSDDLGPGAQVKAPDIASNAVNSADVANGQLNDEDVGQRTFVNFAANIGTVFAHSCNGKALPGVNAQGDHLLLTPSEQDSAPFLDYSILYTAQEHATIYTCNHTDIDINDGTTHFNMLVFDAH
jgi:hypothetical protein